MELLHTGTMDFERSLFKEVEKIIFSKEDQLIVRIAKNQLERSDLIRLDWRASEMDAWLNDNVVNGYMELINERNRVEPQLPKVYAFNTYLAEKLKRHDYNYAEVKRWSIRAKVDLIQMDKIFIPVNDEEHWTLIIIHHDRKRIELYNSLQGDNDRRSGESVEKWRKRVYKLLNQVRQFWRDEYEDKKGEPLEETDWDYEMTGGPYQTNKIDCGVFFCTYANCIATKWPAFFEQRDIPRIRKKMLLELLTTKLHKEPYSTPIFEVSYTKEKVIIETLERPRSSGFGQTVERL